MQTTRLLRTAVATASLASLALLSACGSSDSSTTTGSTTTGSSSSSSSSGAASGISFIKSGQLTTCTHLPYPPFQFEKDGKITGFDVELIDMVAQQLGVKQTIVDTPFETIKTGADLNAKKCDIAAAGMTITADRKKNLDFSVPYFDATQALMAKKGSPITNLDTAKGKKVGSQSATTGEDYVKAKGVDPVSFETSDAELNALKSGQIDVLVQDLPVVSEWLKDPANSAYQVVDNLNTGEQYGFAVKKDGNAQLLKTVDDVITKAKSDGSYDALYQKWIGQKPAGGS